MGVLGAEVLGEDDGEGWYVAALIVFSGERLSRLTGDAVSDDEGTGWMAAGSTLPEATATTAADGPPPTPPARLG